MLIQFGHTRDFDYENELYKPIRESGLLEKHIIILPHDKDNPPVNSKETLQKVDIFFAEVSYPATGLGIELGFASIYGTKIICFYKKGMKIAGSLKYVCNDFIEYVNSEDMIKQIKERI